MLVPNVLTGQAILMVIGPTSVAMRKIRGLFSSANIARLLLRH